MPNYNSKPDICSITGQKSSVLTLLCHENEYIVRISLAHSIISMSKHLKKWHLKYTRSISFIVMPLMIGQLFLAIYQTYQNANSYTLGSLAIIIVIWGATFLQFVPMHKGISSQPITEDVLKNLVLKNRMRTFLWTIVFFWTLLERYL